jgi:hypothetical protein
MTVLEVEERARVPKRGVVDPRQMPDHVVREPERERDRRVCERAHQSGRAIDARQLGRDPQDDEEWRPLREDDVLQEVHRQQVVHAERVDRGHADGEQQHHRAEERGYAPRPDAWCRTAARYATVSPRMTRASAFHDHAYGSTTLR